MRPSTNSRTQDNRILWLLEAAWPNWTPSPVLAQISLQYNARIFGLRAKGWLIVNRVRIVNGVRHGEFRLGSAAVPSNQELRQRKSEGSKQPGLFGDLSPRRYPD